MAEARPSTLLPPAWEVPAEFRRRLGDEAGRQRTMVAGGHVLLVLHAPPAPDSATRAGRYFWRDPTGKWTPSGSSPSQPGVGDLLTAYEKALDALQKAEDAATTARDYFDLLNSLNPLVRSTRNLHQALQDAREAVPDDRQLLLWRDRAYAISRSAELLHADAKHALDFAVAQRAEEEAASSRRIAAAGHRLNVLAAMFFPIVTLAAVFGMELRNGLELIDEQRGPVPMLIILATGAILGLLLTAFITRKP